MSDDRCFCGAAWNDVAEECVEGHPFGEAERFRFALTKIDEIRNSIIGTQSINWSEHIYPLVAALDAAGFKGLPYPEARANVGTLIERAVKAEERVTDLELAIKEAIDDLADGFHDTPLAELRAALKSSTPKESTGK